MPVGDGCTRNPNLSARRAVTFTLYLKQTRSSF